jgi:hypothetical protein
MLPLPELLPLLGTVSVKLCLRPATEDMADGPELAIANSPWEDDVDFLRLPCDACRSNRSNRVQ